MVCPLRKVLPAGILCDFTLPMPGNAGFQSHAFKQIDSILCAHTNNTWYKFIVNVFFVE